MDSDSDSWIAINHSDEDEDVEFTDAIMNPPASPSAMNPSDPEEQQVFNTDLPCMHSYLGQELEVVRGRTVFEDGAVITLDLLQPADVVLMPGQTLPLTVSDPPTIFMLRNCIRNDRTFGVLASWTDGRTTPINGFGTTAEIYEYLPEEGTAGFRVKARARQRFKLLDYENKCRRADASVTRWPAFVYEQYNVQRLVQQIKQGLSSTFIAQKDKDNEKEKETPVKVVIPDDPTELSFWVAQNLPMREEQRVMLLELNSPVQRLRLELKILQQWKQKQQLCCQVCMNSVGSGSDTFSMSLEGPQSTYVNPGGYLHETITLYKVRNIYYEGHPSTEFSWFPGYAWTICKCKRCNQHMGWKFTATKSSLKPAKFWGICRRSISVPQDNPDEDQHSAMIV